MMIRLIVFLKVCLLSYASIGQVSKRDSLWHVIRSTSNDAIKSKTLNELAFMYHRIDPDSAELLANSALTLSSEIKNIGYQAEAHRIKGIVHSSRANYQKAISEYQQALVLFNSNQNLVGQGAVYNNLGLVYERLGNLTKSLDSYVQAQRIGIEINDNYLLAKVYNNKGIILDIMGRYDSAISCFYKSLEIRATIPNHPLVSSSYTNLGLVFFKLKNYKEAEEKYLKSLDISLSIDDSWGVANCLENMGLLKFQLGEFTQAKGYFTNAKEQFFLMKDKNGVAANIRSLGDCFYQMGDYPKAIEYLRGALQVYTEINSKRGLARTFQSMSLCQIEVGKINEAINLARRALRLFEEVGEIQESIKTARILTQLYSQVGDIAEAYRYLSMQLSYSDSLQVVESQKNALRLEYEYQFKQKRDSLEFARQNERNIFEADIARRKTIQQATFGAIALLIILLYISYRYYRSKQKSNKALESQYMRVSELSDYKDSMNAMIVHDFKNSLNTVINFSEESPTKRRLQSINQAGKFMLNMVLNMLDVQKFETAEVKLSSEDYPVGKIVLKAIDQLNYLIDQKSIKLNFAQSTEFICRVDQDLILRCIVNILSNAIKFEPINGQIDITVEQQDQNIIVSIKDHGPGIPEDKLDKVFDKFSQVHEKKSGSVRSTGIGLTFCKMVIEAHGGTIGVESTEGEGSNFFFTLPLISVDNQSKPEQVIAIQQEQLVVISSEEKAALGPYIAELQKWEVYDFSEVMAILDRIEPDSENINAWKEALTKALQNGNEAKYKEMLDYE